MRDDPWAQPGPRSIRLVSDSTGAVPVTPSMDLREHENISRPFSRRFGGCLPIAADLHHHLLLNEEEWHRAFGAAGRYQSPHQARVSPLFRATAPPKYEHRVRAASKASRGWRKAGPRHSSGRDDTMRSGTKAHAARELSIQGFNGKYLTHVDTGHNALYSFERSPRTGVDIPTTVASSHCASIISKTAPSGHSTTSNRSHASIRAPYQARDPDGRR
jgi:hypothetical protein